MRRRMMLWLAVLAAALIASGLGLAFFGARDEAAGPIGNAPPSKESVEVPKLIGMQYRPVQELLARRGLRWGFSGTKYVWSKSPAANMWSTGDDDYVTEQSPTAGTKVAPGSVIRIRTSCTLGTLPPGTACID